MQLWHVCSRTGRKEDDISLLIARRLYNTAISTARAYIQMGRTLLPRAWWRFGGRRGVWNLTWTLQRQTVVCLHTSAATFLLQRYCGRTPATASLALYIGSILILYFHDDKRPHPVGGSCLGPPVPAKPLRCSAVPTSSLSLPGSGAHRRFGRYGGRTFSKTHIRAAHLKRHGCHTLSLVPACCIATFSRVTFHLNVSNDLRTFKLVAGLRAAQPLAFLSYARLPLSRRRGTSQPGNGYSPLLCRKKKKSSAFFRRFCPPQNARHATAFLGDFDTSHGHHAVCSAGLRMSS